MRLINAADSTQDEKTDLLRMSTCQLLYDKSLCCTFGRNSQHISINSLIFPQAGQPYRSGITEYIDIDVSLATYRTNRTTTQV